MFKKVTNLLLHCCCDGGALSARSENTKMRPSETLFLLFTTLLLLFVPGWLKGQALDSLDHKLHSSVEARIINKLDSIRLFGITRFTEVQKSYDSVMNSSSGQMDRLFSKIDSLQKHGEATDRLTSKLDSLNTLKDKSIAAINSKMEKLNSNVNNGINELNLPPELRKQANKLTSMMNKLDITKPNVLQEYLNVSVLDLGSINGPDIPSVEISNPLQDITNIDIPSIDTGSIGDQIKEYQSTIADLPAGLDGTARLAEEQAGKIGEITNVQTELGKVGELTSATTTLQDQEKLKQELVQEAQKQAVDHFAGKKEQLDKALQSISKYKQKFSTVTSLNDIPKKAPNEMKGKPLIERIVPGIAFQLQKKDDDLLVDFNLYFAYRFTKRFSSGAGWNHRVGYNTDQNGWSSENAVVYGPRLFSEYKLGKGFSPRVEVEVMNTFVPPFLSKTKTDPGSRQWVSGAFVGMKKDYKVYKNIKGTALVMLRLFDPERKSPYADVVNARFGFEFPMKKKVK